MRVTGPKPDCANTRFRSRADGEVDVAAPPAAVAEVMAAGDAAAVDAAEDVGEVIDEAPGVRHSYLTPGFDARKLHQRVRIGARRRLALGRVRLDGCPRLAQVSLQAAHCLRALIGVIVVEQGGNMACSPPSIVDQRRGDAVREEWSDKSLASSRSIRS